MLRPRNFRAASLCSLAISLTLVAAADADAQRLKRREKRAGGPAVTVTSREFGKTKDGQPIQEFTLSDPARQITVKLIEFGAAITSVRTPDKSGRVAEITLGWDDLAGWEKNPPYFGVTVGRYGNRIAKGKFTIDGKEYSLATNNGPNHLHGGLVGFNKQVWKGAATQRGNEALVSFTRRSADGEEGYPGNLDCTVTFSLNDQGELKIHYQATTDKATHVNLTNHAYWNLAGRGSGDVLAHEITIHADRYLPVDDTLIPTGELASVKGTPMDLTQATAIGAKIKDVQGGGYDHCYVLNKSAAGKLELAAKVVEAKSGRVLEILTTEPGVQFYTGNFLDGGPDGAGNKKHGGFCLETQHYPDSPNRDSFPSTLLKPGAKYETTTVHRFSVQR